MVMPEEFNKLCVLVEFMPLEGSVPCEPFSGMVLNIHVCLLAHVDREDEKLCVIVPFGDFEGGELVLSDLGLVFDLKNRDMLVFRSDILVHFNLKVRKGFRGSFVLSSDSHLNNFLNRMKQLKATNQIVSLQQ